MADARIGISITADAGNALSGLQKVSATTQVLQTQFERLQKLASLPNLNFRQQERLNSLLARTQGELTRSDRAFRTANASMERFTRSNTQASASLFNFGRIVQDAPYAVLAGNIGAIANNIDPLVESFGRLKATTGSTGGALKAMAGSLIGPAGIGIAVSLVTSGLILFGDKLFGTKQKAEESKASLDNFKSSIEGVTDSVSKLKDELQFLNQLSSINIKIAGLPTLLDLQGQSIAQSGLVFDLQQKLNSLVGNIQTINADPDLSEKDRREALEKNAEAIKSVEKDLTNAIQGQTIIRRQITLQRNEDQKKANEEALKEWEEYVSKTIARGKELASFYEGRKKVPLFSVLDTREDQFRKALDFLNRLKRGTVESVFQTSFIIEPLFPINKVDITKQFVERVKEIQETVRQTAEGTNPLQSLKLEMPYEIKLRLKSQQDAAEELRKQVEDINKSINNLNVEALSGLGESIGNALSTNDIKNAFKVFGNTIAEGLTSIGKQFIKIGATALLAKSALKSLFTNPALSIAAGIALVAAGAALRSATSSGLRGRASGGPVKAGQAYMVGEIGREMFIPNQDGTIVPNGKIGGVGAGSMVVQITGEFRQNGNDLVATISQVNRTQSRTA